MEDWNDMFWQGKRKNQVEFSYKTIVGVFTLTFILLLITYFIDK